MSDAWLVLAAGDDRQHGGNDGYVDEPAATYSWDDTVPNHAALSVGDAIVLWDKRMLIGASVIERIEENDAIKTVYRCPSCGGSHIKRRKTLDPPWRCFRCSSNFADPAAEARTVHTYVSRHDVGWVDLDGVLSGAELRMLCRSPKSQLSLRPLMWADFRLAVGRRISGAPLAVLDHRSERITGGHRHVTVRVRRGQGRFRARLLAEYGHVCAITGPAPLETLEAGHLYSYADIAEHHHHGGLLLRRDVHRLFDLGQIAVHPRSLTLDVHPEVAAYAPYVSLHGQPLAVAVGTAQRTWLSHHWNEHRPEVPNSA